jgi:hypothetical protein
MNLRSSTIFSFGHSVAIETLRGFEPLVRQVGSGGMHTEEISLAAIATYLRLEQALHESCGLG